MKRTALRRRAPLKRGTKKLRVHGQSDVSTLKREIQALLRQVAMIRDKGCILRHYQHMLPHQYLNCGPIKYNGELVLQFDHMITRANSATYADSRLGNILCKRHHFYFKKQHPGLFEDIVLNHMGAERRKLYERCKNDHTPHHMTKGDWRMAHFALEEELEELKNGT